MSDSKTIAPHDNFNVKYLLGAVIALALPLLHVLLGLNIYL